MLKQKTLGGSFSLNGKGLHTGVNLTVTFNPAPEEVKVGAPKCIRAFKARLQK